MNRAALLLLLLLAAPGASAWVSCNDAGLSAPVPLDREPPAYPDAVRATGIEGTVEIALTVLRDGRIGWVRVQRASPEGYFEQASRPTGGFGRSTRPRSSAIASRATWKSSTRSTPPERCGTRA